MKLNLGCGINKKEGYINIDCSSEINPDKVWNLEKTPLPFKDNSIKEIKAEHVFEHVQNFIPLLHDLWRISKNKAIIKIKVPFYSAWGQFNDPTHVRFFTPFTFNYFSGEKTYSHQVNAKKEMFFIRKVKINFGIGKTKILNKIINPIVNLNHKFYCRFFAWIFPSAEIEFELKVLK